MKAHHLLRVLLLLYLFLISYTLHAQTPFQRVVQRLTQEAGFTNIRIDSAFVQFSFLNWHKEESTVYVRQRPSFEYVSFATASITIEFPSLQYEQLDTRSLLVLLRRNHRNAYGFWAADDDADRLVFMQRYTGKELEEMTGGDFKYQCLRMSEQLHLGQSVIQIIRH